MTTTPHPTQSQYGWYHDLKALFVQSLERYRVGERNPAQFYTPEQVEYLASIGLTPQEVYDFAEDHAKDEEGPDWETFLLISAARRDYFRTIQHGQLSTGKQVCTDDLPARDAKLEGIPWLPRLIKKAEAKLRGEMAPDLMYGCGGDRNFFREHHLHPADFLRHVWASDGDESKVLAYVKAATPPDTDEPAI